MIMGLLKIMLVGVLVGVIGWQLGEYYWAFELFSHFMPQYAAVSAALTVLFFINQRNRLGVASLLLAITCLFQLLPLHISEAPGEGREISILQWNVLYSPEGLDAKAKWLKRQTRYADIIILQETTKDWIPTLEAMKSDYPYQYNYLPKSENKWDYRGAAIMSRLPVVSMTHVGDAMPYLRLELMVTASKSAVVYAIHPPPPMSSNAANMRNTNLMDVSVAMSKESAHYKIIAGDFNTTRYSPWFLHMTRLTGMKDSFEGFGPQTTWPEFMPWFAGIAIDQMLISRNIGVKQKYAGGYIVSDHKPVFSRLVFR